MTHPSIRALLVVSVTCVLVITLGSAAPRQKIITMSPGDAFKAKLAQLTPGDTLVLHDGTYPAVFIECGVNANSGTAGAPITLKAQHERRAKIQSNGAAVPFFMKKCAYWTIEGLSIENGDHPSNATGIGDTVYLFMGHHLTLRRNLITHNNRYYNGSCLDAGGVRDSLFEENEIYECIRNVFSFNNYSVEAGWGPSGHNIVRRNYINTRNWPILPGGYFYGTRDVAFNCYPCQDTLFENNIAENTAAGFDMRATGAMTNNTYLGNIVRDATYAMVGNQDGGPIRDIQITNLVGVEIDTIGLYIRSAANVRCDHCSFVDGKDGKGSGLIADEGNPASYPYSTFVTNVLVHNLPRTGIGLYKQSDWAVDHAVVFGSAVPFAPAGGARFSNARTQDPQLGTCKVWIPEGSPLKRAGTNGKDIGANILYRYQDGQLTDQPLWGPDGSFPHGAIVPGVNDIPGKSLFDIQDRLHVNKNSCNFPAGYTPSGNGTSRLPAPKARGE